MKFSTFQRCASMIKNRLTYIQSQISTFESNPDLSNSQKAKVNLLIKESSSKHEEFKSKLDSLNNTDSKPCSDYDEDTIMEIENTISDLFISIQEMVANKWPSLAETLSILPSEKSHDTSNTTSQSNMSTASSNTNSSLKLPKISLPKFNGNVNNWVTFHNLFETLVHQNPSLTSIEKLQFLLSSLEHEAVNEIKSLPLSNENYTIAWNRLVKRYHNKRRLISYHINKILDLPTISNPSLKTLRNFISTYNEHSQALVPLGTDISKESSVLVSLTLRKLDTDLRKRFEQSRTTSNDEMPTIMELINFLEEECSQLEATGLTCSSNLTTKIEQKPNNVFSKPNKTILLASDSQSQHNSTVCSFCQNSEHTLHKCEKFHNLTPKDRFNFIKTNGHCVNCLGTSHTLKSCYSKHTCSTCKGKHHSLLHFRDSFDSNAKLTSNTSSLSNTTPNNKESKETLKDTKSNFVGISCDQEKTVLLATTLIKVTSPNGQSEVFRALLDSCAQASFISQNVCQVLQLKRHILNDGNISGLSCTNVRTKGYSEITISSLSGRCLANSFPVIVLDKITNNLPRTALNPNIKRKLDNLVLADPNFDTPGPIDVLIGADLFAKSLLGEKYDLGENMPTAINTIFGFVLMGNSYVSKECNSPNVEFSSNNIVTLLSINDMALHDSLQKFWQLEEPPYESKLTMEEQECEKIFSSTTTRDSSGRYIVRLPFKESTSTLGSSSENAKRMFYTMEKKMKSQEDLRIQYKKFMEDYLSSGHMKICDKIPNPDETHCYLPHHGVFKQDKIRVVFNASSHTSTNVSLNQILHSGPKLQNNLMDIIFNFRRYSIVFTCDIRQMFRQIRMHEDDQKYQLIYWREDPDLPLETYQLTTVTYGMTSSSYLSIRTIQQLLKDEGTEHPLAASSIENQIYVDDILLGADSEDDAINLQKDVINLFNKGGFSLRKWSSNSELLLANIPENHKESPLALSPPDQPLFSILGLKWFPEHDTFSYLVQLPSEMPTKRNILSCIARIYDPCGWVSPLVFWAKALIQRLWILKLSWDDTLPSELTDEWNCFLKELPELEDIRIPRSLGISKNDSVQMFGFCDASETGFSSCVYLKTTTVNGLSEIKLLLAKTKVAPLKRVSIPKLELCAAHLLSKLSHHCINLLSPHVKITDIALWSDSTIVLSWIQTPPHRLKTYVANRVTEIQELTQPLLWRHIRSHENPADCASRGILPHSLKNHSLWWNGPQWLKKPADQWPASNFNVTTEEKLPDMKTNSTSTNLIASAEPEWNLLSKFSKWTQLQSTFAYILRFINNSKDKSIREANGRNMNLTASDLSAATTKICKLVQKQYFADEIINLQKGKPCGKRLASLSPFIDNDGIIRVGGRICHSDLSLNEKHPIILPKSHSVTTLLIDYYHEKYLHAGPTLLQSLMSKQFWILSARSIIRSRIHKCMRCFRSNPKLTNPKMGDLPPSRLKPKRVFDTCGTDYAGPFLVKVHKLKRVQPVKVYICLFVCFTTKAVHIEIVNDLTSDAYIATLTRFVSRRGLPSNIYSDCGSNYIGAASQIKTIIKNLFSDESHISNISCFSNENSIKFHFSPAKAPNFGGLWERAVKSIKYHLRRVIGEQLLTMEEFSTLCCKVEAILNSRPLTALSTDPAEADALTPGHFITGSPLTSLPEPQLPNQPVNRLRRWHMLQSFSQQIWKRWKTEYLHTLQSRSKWTDNVPTLKEGDVVVIHDENSRPLTWNLGRITKLFTGKDGVCRVVQVKTKKGYLTRPASKVSRLPID